MYKQGEGGGLKNSDLALPEGSIAKRRGVKVMMMTMRYEGRKGVRELTKWAPPKPLTPNQVAAPDSSVPWRSSARLSLCFTSYQCCFAAQRSFTFLRK